MRYRALLKFSHLWRDPKGSLLPGIVKCKAYILGFDTFGVSFQVNYFNSVCGLFVFFAKKSETTKLGIFKI